MFLLLHIVIWNLALVTIEMGLFNCLKFKGGKVADEEEELDDNVIEEQNRIDNTDASQLAVKASHLRKVYGGCGSSTNVAVKDISFGLEFGDCFCLLGVNGAGKNYHF
jgi:ABC-type glutathione transport system ATPase component